MRTLITGVAGFVGRHLAHELAQDQRAELNGADHLELGDSEADQVLRCHLKSHRPLDVANFDQVRGCILETKPDRIVHLAAQASGSESIKRPAETYRVNAIGALNVLEAARVVVPGATVLLVGSADIYGSGAPGQKIREDAPIRPMNAYALSKAAQCACVGGNFEISHDPVVERRRLVEVAFGGGVVAPGGALGVPRLAAGVRKSFSSRVKMREAELKRKNQRGTRRQILRGKFALVCSNKRDSWLEFLVTRTCADRR